MPRRKKASHGRPPMSPLELDVMDVVWPLGDCTSAEVIDAFTAKKRALAPTTIRTVLASLRKKGYLKPIPTTERGFRLRPTVGREAVARRSLKELLGAFFAGSPRQAIAYMLDETDLTDDELDEIRHMLDSRRTEGS